MNKLEELIGSTIYDLTHLEINTIIKEEMSASKAPASPRLILQDLSKKFHFKLIELGTQYGQCFDVSGSEAEALFRGQKRYEGSGYNSFKELSQRAEDAGKLLSDKFKMVSQHFPEDTINADIKMLLRIKTISDDVRRILKNVDTQKDEQADGEPIYHFDDTKTIDNFRVLNTSDAKDQELNLDLRQLLLIKKANDIGTEKVVLQTIIGIDGDVTTRISRAFADKPINYINNMHHEAIGISVKFWDSLVNVVIKLGENILRAIKP